MKVFISWSGERSKALAEVIYQWLPGVIQAVKPYYSPDDITKGSRWSSEMGKELDASRVGIICLTTDNLSAPWIMFEAGALSKSIDRAKVCPILFGVDATDLKGPLVQFQACKFEKDEMRRVVRMMNDELGDNALAGDVLDSVFEMWWPRLEEKAKAELSRPHPEESSSGRSDRDLLQEILGLSRSMARSSRQPVAPQAIADLVECYGTLVDALAPEKVTVPLASALKTMQKPLDYLVLKHVPLGLRSQMLKERFTQAKLRLEGGTPPDEPEEEEQHEQE